MIPLGFVLRIVGPLAIVGVAWLHGCSVGQAGEQRKAQAELLKATQQARQTEADWQTNVEALQDVHQIELARVAVERDDAARRLRNRPAGRLPAAAACTTDGAGATGAQLSGPDAEVLGRLAADADRVAADLRACQGWIETVKR